MLERMMSFKVSTKITLITMVIYFIGVGILFYLNQSSYRASQIEGYIQKATWFTAAADETKNHTSQLQKDNVFDKRALEQDLRATLSAGRKYSESKIFGTIPVVAGWTAAEQAAEKEGLDFKIAAFNARNKDRDPNNDPVNGKFRAALLTDLRGNFLKEKEETIYKINTENNSIHFMRAIILNETCMSCHGHPSTSAFGNGKDILGFQMEDWKPGDMHGAYEIVMPLDGLDAELRSAGIKNFFTMFIILIIAVFTIRQLSKVGITDPLHKCVVFAEHVGSGNLDSTIDIRTKEEIGQLVSSLQNMSSNLKRAKENEQTVQKQVQHNAEALNHAAAELTALATDLEQKSQNIVDQSNMIAAATEELSTNMSGISSASEESQTNLRTVTSATEQMTSAIGEVAQSTERARSITNNAVDKVRVASMSVNELGSAATEINLVTKTIVEIAEQTKLLALNATIEAARAGEAGKGFAVVASEVKELAKQTNEATVDINQKIEAIQKSTRNTVEEINGISKVMDEVNEIVNTIATAVEEQNVTTHEIAHNIGEATNGVGEVMKNVIQAADVSREVAGNIVQVTDHISLIHEKVARLNDNASTLNHTASELQDMVKKFDLG
jgi:methyl-accepting chemotaxis protein